MKDADSDGDEEKPQYGPQMPDPRKEEEGQRKIQSEVGVATVTVTAIGGDSDSEEEGGGGGDEARRRVRRSRPRLVFHAALTSNVRLDARFHLPVARHERGEALDVASQARAHPLREPKDARVRRVQRTRLHRRLVLLVGHRRG